MGFVPLQFAKVQFGNFVPSVSIKAVFILHLEMPHVLNFEQGPLFNTFEIEDTPFPSGICREPWAITM